MANPLSSDKPLENPKNDRLGYKGFAKRLANSLLDMVPTDGLVISIYGPWGSGKSTLLNFVKFYLEETDLESKPEFLYFNPWWFSGADDVVRSFFEQLISTFDASDKSLKALREALHSLGSAVSESPIPYGKWAGAIAKLIKPKNETLTSLRAKVEKLLIDNHKKIIIVIDDIDRLTPDEIRKMFRLVKAVANLPNLIYLLAFDKKVVENALAGFNEGAGDVFLEKIVQVPFELPLPEKATIRQLLFSKLDMVLEEIPDLDFDQQYWTNMFFDGIDHFINTPRDVMRLSNTLAVTFPAVAREVNPVDFIAIESLRVFQSDLYAIIRDNSDSFVGYRSGRSSSETEYLENFHDSYLSSFDNEKTKVIKRFLKRLFPNLEGIWGNNFYSAEFHSTWRKSLRICSPEIFPIYFRLELAEESISTYEVRSIIDTMGNHDVFMEKLRELSKIQYANGMTKAHVFLQRLEDYTEEFIPAADIPDALLAIFDIADSLYEAEPEQRGFYEFGIDTQLGRVILRLLRRLPGSERHALLTKIINEAKSISTMVREIIVLGQMHGKYGSKEPTPDKEQIISLEQLNELEELLVSRIAKESISDNLFECPNLSMILQNWREWGESNDCDNWIDRVKDNKEFIKNLILSILSVRFSYGLSFDDMGDRSARKTYYLNYDYLASFVDPEFIAPIVKDISKDSDLAERERIAINEFLEAHEDPPAYSLKHDLKRREKPRIK